MRDTKCDALSTVDTLSTGTSEGCKAPGPEVQLLESRHTTGFADVVVIQDRKDRLFNRTQARKKRIIRGTQWRTQSKRVRLRQHQLVDGLGQCPRLASDAFRRRSGSRFAGESGFSTVSARVWAADQDLFALCHLVTASYHVDGSTVWRMLLSLTLSISADATPRIRPGVLSSWER